MVEREEAVKVCKKVSTSSFSVRMRFCMLYSFPDVQIFVVKEVKCKVKQGVVRRAGLYLQC